MSRDPTDCVEEEKNIREKKLALELFHILYIYQVDHIWSW